MPDTLTAPAPLAVEAPTEAGSPRLSHGEGDHDTFAHFADKTKIAEAYVTGCAITAICGKRWVPTKDPEKYPICPSCLEALALIEAARLNEGDDS